MSWLIWMLNESNEWSLRPMILSLNFLLHHIRVSWLLNQVGGLLKYISSHQIPIRCILKHIHNQLDFCKITYVSRRFCSTQDELKALKAKNEEEFGFSKKWFRAQIEENILKRQIEQKNFEYQIERILSDIKTERKVHDSVLQYYDHEILVRRWHFSIISTFPWKWCYFFPSQRKLNL